MVDGSGLENRQGESPRGFESHPLRHSISDCGLRIAEFGMRIVDGALNEEIRTPFDWWGALRAGFGAKLQLQIQKQRFG